MPYRFPCVLGLAHSRPIVASRHDIKPSSALKPAKCFPRSISCTPTSSFSPNANDAWRSVSSLSHRRERRVYDGRTGSNSSVSTCQNSIAPCQMRCHSRMQRNESCNKTFPVSLQQLQHGGGDTLPRPRGKPPRRPPLPPQVPPAPGDTLQDLRRLAGKILPKRQTCI